MELALCDGRAGPDPPTEWTLSFLSVLSTHAHKTKFCSGETEEEFFLKN